MKAIPLDIRIIVATNRDLLKMIKDGSFRKDLYYRIDVLPINIPPLRERRDDIMILMEHYLNKHNISVNCLSELTQTLLMEYEWPGNVRELENKCTYLGCLIDIDGIDENTINQKIMELITSNKIDLNLSVKNMDRVIDHIITEEQYDILKEIYISNRENKRVGRKSISDRLKKRNIFLTEQEVRKYLNGLRDLSFVKINKGRAGTIILNKGIELIESMK